jgi:hypothetical protein
LATHELNDVS